MLTFLDKYNIIRKLDKTYIEYTYAMDGVEGRKRFGFGATDEKVNTIEAASNWEIEMMIDPLVTHLMKHVNTFRDLK